MIPRLQIGTILDIDNVPTIRFITFSKREKIFLKNTASLEEKNYYLFKISVNYEFPNGEMTAPDEIRRSKNGCSIPSDEYVTDII